MWLVLLTFPIFPKNINPKGLPPKTPNTRLKIKPNKKISKRKTTIINIRHFKEIAHQGLKAKLDKLKIRKKLPIRFIVMNPPKKNLNLDK